MAAYSDFLKIITKERFQLEDITDAILDIVRKSKVKDGIINIVSKHTTTAILLNENEPLLWSDFVASIRAIFFDFAPGFYRHDDLDLRRKLCGNIAPDECQNAGSHCRSIFLTNSQTLNIINGKLDLGKWQRIIFVELDKAKEREISVMVLGLPQNA